MPDGLRRRLEEVLRDPRADVLVADDGGALVGAATYFLVPVAHDSRPWCRITTLVVDETHRGHGIGRLLVDAAETAARRAGCSRIEATSALHRSGAHRFYDRLGYGRRGASLMLLTCSSADERPASGSLVYRDWRYDHDRRFERHGGLDCVENLLM